MLHFRPEPMEGRELRLMEVEKDWGCQLARKYKELRFSKAHGKCPVSRWTLGPGVIRGVA